MEHLTKQQIVLLCLLVSFVSSIATGIVTVSLLDQSAPAVTQTINRVVERTIERVGPNATSTRETVIVKEDQATVDAISRVSKALVRILSEESPVGLGILVSEIGLGILVSEKGRIVAHTSAVSGGRLSARFVGGNVVSVTLVSRDPVSGVTVYQAEQSADSRTARAYSAVTFANTATLQLGQSVISVGGLAEPSVATGIISSLSSGRIRTDIRDSDFDSPKILVNLLGEVVGMRDFAPDNSFISSQSLQTYATP